MFADVGQGRQKGKVERNFGVVQNELALIPGYIGNDVAKRALIEAQTASKIDIRTSKATRIRKDKLLTEDELRKILEITAAKHSDSYALHKNSILSDTELERLRRNLGKSDTRILSESGVSYNNATYTGVALWTFGLKKGDKVTIMENIDDVNCLYVYQDDEFVGEIYNKDDDRCMSLEEHRKSKKAYVENHIKPIAKEIREAQRKMDEFQDELVQATMGEEALYIKQKISPKIKSKSPVVASTSSSVAKWDDGTYEFVKDVI